LPLRPQARRGHDAQMWYFHAVQDVRGWSCRHGLEVIDTHPAMEEAVAHLRSLAELSPPAQVIAHYLTGSIRTVASLD
jgi:hypothetical protein